VPRVLKHPPRASDTDDKNMTQQQMQQQRQQQQLRHQQLLQEQASGEERSWRHFLGEQPYILYNSQGTILSFSLLLLLKHTRQKLVRKAADPPSPTVQLLTFARHQVKRSTACAWLQPETRGWWLSQSSR